MEQPPLRVNLLLAGLIDEDSTLGELLKAIIGCNGNPSLLEVIGYWLLVLVGIPWLVERRVSRRLPLAQAADPAA